MWYNIIVFWPAFGCAQHLKAGQNTQQVWTQYFSRNWQIFTFFVREFSEQKSDSGRTNTISMGCFSICQSKTLSVLWTIKSKPIWYLLRFLLAKRVKFHKTVNTHYKAMVIVKQLFSKLISDNSCCVISKVSATRGSQVSRGA